MFNLRSLQVLDLSYNDLADIQTNTFIGLERLQSLNISSNSLRVLHASIFNGLSSLVTLLVDDNSIETLQAGAFANMPLLERLDLSGNNLRTFSGDVFGTINNPLKRLFLRNNHLESIEADSFTYTPNLEVLAISHNEIVTLPDELLANVRLRILQMQHNLVDEITLPFFTSLNFAEEILLDHNRLTFIPEADGDYSNLKRMTIEGNPWQCACFDEFLGVLTLRNIVYRRPESRYYKGARPLCVVTDQACLKDVTQARELGLLEIYEAANHEAATDGHNNMVNNNNNRL